MEKVWNLILYSVLQGLGDPRGGGRGLFDQLENIMLNTWRFVSSLCPAPVVMVLKSGELQVGDWLDPVPRPCCSLIVLVLFIF